MSWSLEGGPTRGLLVTRGNRCPFYFERDPHRWGFPGSSLSRGCGPHVWLSPRARAEFGHFYLECDPCRWGFLRSSLGGKPPSAVDLTYVSALGLRLNLDAYLDAMR